VAKVIFISMKTFSTSTAKGHSQEGCSSVMICYDKFSCAYAQY